MAKSENRGFFITLEGPEGGGKTTQAKRLVKWLEERGYPVVFTREPGGTPLGEKIRDILIDMGSKALDPMAEAMLFTAARRQHVQQLILPSLREGVIVVCDRFADATIAYQGGGRQVDMADLLQLVDMGIWGVFPNLTLLLDVDEATSQQRMQHRLLETGQALDRFETSDEDFLQRVRQSYLSLAHDNPQRIRVIDGSLGEEEVFESIVDEVDYAVKLAFPDFRRLTIADLDL